MSKLMAAVLAALLLLLPVSAGALTLTSDAGERLSGSDRVTFTVTATADAATATDASLRIRLSDDLTLIEDSVRMASPTNARVLDVIPGSDGFVVLMDSLSAGDTVVFEAELTGTGQSDVSCDAMQGTGETAQLTYINAAYEPPEPEAVQPSAQTEPVSEAAAVSEPAPALSGGAIAVVCVAGVLIVSSVVYFILIRKRFANKNAGQDEPSGEDAIDDETKL